MSENTKIQYTEFTVVRHKKKFGKKHNLANSPFSGDPTNFPDIDIDQEKAHRFFIIIILNTIYFSLIYYNTL